MTRFVDVRLLERGVRELIPAGPEAEPAEIAQLVGELRAAAETSVDLVLDIMRLDQACADAARARAAAGEVLVVDRLGWAKATAQSMNAMLEPALGAAVAKALEETRLSSTVELAAVLSVLSTRVLGQFDPFGGAQETVLPAGSGRLLLVAPTIARTEALLDVPARDFRLWVALHETTHRLQFAIAPWLEGHLRTLTGALLDDSAGAGDASAGLGAIVRRLPQVLRGDAELVDVLTGSAQQEALDEVLAVMSLLEGHADVVMDAVGTGTIPSLRSIRKKFEARRAGGIGPGGAVGRLLGADAKLRQYREGAAFVRAVVRRVGHAGFARVFDGPENLPASAEIARPQDWVRRVHGR